MMPLRHPATWLLAIALRAASATALAQEGTPGQRAQVQAQLDAAVSAVQAARTSLDSGQAKLVAARVSLESADTARVAADRQLARTEAAAARGRVTRRQVEADRALADTAATAVTDARTGIAAAEAELAHSQVKLMAAKTAVDTAAASAGAFLGDAPAN